MSQGRDWTKEALRRRVIRQGFEASATGVAKTIVRKEKRSALDNQVAPIVIPVAKARLQILNKRMAMLVAVKKNGNAVGDLDLAGLNKEISRVQAELNRKTKLKKRRSAK